MTVHFTALTGYSFDIGDNLYLRTSGQVEGLPWFLHLAVAFGRRLRWVDGYTLLLASSQNSLLGSMNRDLELQLSEHADERRRAM